MYIETSQWTGAASAASALSALAGSASAGSAGGLGEIGSEEFMMILLAQLRHQNPLEPMQDSEWMGQMTQLNSLQELKKIENAIQEMVQSGQLTNAAVLVGKTVQVRDAEGEIIQGKVTGVSLVGGKVMLSLGDKQVPFSSLTSVVEEEEESDVQPPADQPE
jgi:flagellar basal-body rod modification protein FlgD